MNESRVDLGLASPWMNAAGFMGYLPQHQSAESYKPGAFVTAPISLLPRAPAHNRCVASYPGGFLLHNGHPNPGLKKVLKSYASKWKNLPMPVWVHLLATSAYETAQTIRELEGLENVTAIELGLPPGIGVKKQLELLQTSIGELPVFVCIPLDGLNMALIDQLPSLGDFGVVISAPRGMLNQNGRVISGRLFGPSLHLQMMAGLCRLRDVDMPVVAGCGVFSVEQGEEALRAGAAAVQVDGWCWHF